MSTEREYKFSVDARWAMPAIDDVCLTEPSDPIVQTATYYDTPDLRLTRAGASIRYRDDDGWTVKLPTDDQACGMIARNELVFGGSPDAPPTPALELVTAHVRTAQLVAVARLRTQRRESTLRVLEDGDLPAGATIGVLTDDVCTVVEGPVGRQFREVELELAPDAPEDAARAIVTRLRAAGASDADPIPKVARALGRAAAAPADVAPFPIGRRATVEAVIRHALSDALSKLVANDSGVRIGDDHEAVHQARVATRRLRSHLRTFGTLLDESWSEPLRAELGWLGAELGALRDADVLLARLQGRVDDLDEVDQRAAKPIVDRLIAERSAARATLMESLRSRRYLDLLDRLVDGAERPRVALRIAGDDADTLRDLVRRPWRKLRRAVTELPDPAPDEALHAVRIRAKRARYAAEVVEPAFGRGARNFAKALTQVQDVLGEHQDAVVAGAWLRGAAAGLQDVASVYVLGQLVATERAAADTARADWPDAWRAAKRRRLRDWM